MASQITSLQMLVQGFSFKCASIIITPEQVRLHGELTGDITLHNVEAIQPDKKPSVQGSLLAALPFRFHQEAVCLSDVPVAVLTGHDRYILPTRVGVPIFAELEIEKVRVRTKKAFVDWVVRLFQEHNGSLKMKVESRRLMLYARVT